LTIGFDTGLFAALVGGGGLLAIIGLLDDFYSLARRWRLLAQVFASAWALYCLQGIDLIPQLPQWLWWGEQIVVLIGLVWLINLYNFMDGIDSLAASEAVFVGLAFMLLAVATADVNHAMVLLAAASAGFLLLNRPPARLFMGDGGSYFLGYTLGVGLLFAAEQQIVSFWAGLILLAVFVVDSSYTLVRRMIGRARWYEPHRSHAYQRAARRYGSHARVTVGVVVLNTLWLLPLAWLASRSSQWGGMLTLVAAVPLLLIANYLKAGRE
jgi:Fuc2NAc and GlcNAc transferase